MAGLNGSGKSVLMKLLAGDLTATGGNAYMAGLTLSGDLRRWQMAIGYSCDGRLGLVPVLTGAEMLDLVARLRGISPVANRRLVVSSTLLLLSPLQGDKLCGDYTVTEQKLLSLGIAIVGVPPILLLDEPYSDVEPFFRHQIVRFLQILKSVRATTMVISAHRLSHCEELCDRAIVLEDCKIETMGDYDQMNHKFGRCYMIKMRLPADRRADRGLQRQLIELMQEEFHQCAPCYSYKGMIAFRVGKTYTNWSEVYSKVAAHKSNLGLPEVFVGDISFEDILVGLARCQILTMMIRPNTISTAPS
ncbi:ATP-binding cassette sub-family A member 17-like [Ixodes scapularis]